ASLVGGEAALLRAVAFASADQVALDARRAGRGDGAVGGRAGGRAAGAGYDERGALARSVGRAALRAEVAVRAAATSTAAAGDDRHGHGDDQEQQQAEGAVAIYERLHSTHLPSRRHRAYG